MSEKPEKNSEISKPAAKPTTLRGWIESDTFRAEIAKVLPRHLTPERFTRIAALALTRTPLLAECEPASVLQCLMTSSQYGLEPDGRRAHLIPFRNKRGSYDCQLILDYKGIVELVMRTGLVANLHADVVCDNDDFEFDCGQVLHHRIDFKKDRGGCYAVYAKCRFKDGTEAAAVMTRDEVEAVRARSKAAKAGPWVTDWNEMAKKTAFRRLSKWLPFSSEIRQAIESDDEEFEAPALPAPTQAALPVQSKSDELADMLQASISAAAAEPVQA